MSIRNASIEHAISLGNGATITPQLGVYYQTDYDFRGSATGKGGGGPSYCNQEAYSMFRARVTYAPASENWQATLIGSNINGAEYFQVCGASRSGVFDYRHGAPAQWGLEWNYSWDG